MRLGIALVLIIAVLVAACEDVEDTPSFIEDADSPLENQAPAALNQTTEPSPALPLKEWCGDGVCQPSETKCTCAQDCGECKGDATPPTMFACVEGKCKIVTKPNLCGNGMCESGEEASCATDCPACEADNNPCTQDRFDPQSRACMHEPVIPCCGNGVCEPATESGSCLIDCKNSNISLKDYPAPFIMNKKFNTFIIVGAQGTGASVAAGIDIIRGWGYTGSNPGYDEHARLDKEVDSIQGKNAILIGSACENKHVEALMKPVRDCRDGLEPGVGLLRLYQTGPDSYALVVAGFSGEEVRQAARVLEKYKDFGLNGFQMEVR